MSEKTGLPLEVVGAKIASGTTLAGGAGGFAGWFVSSNGIGLLGLAVAVLGLIVNAYFQARRDRREAAEQQARWARDAARDRREAEESEARIKAMQERCEIVQ